MSSSCEKNPNTLRNSNFGGLKGIAHKRKKAQADSSEEDISDLVYEQRHSLAEASEQARILRLFNPKQVARINSESLNFKIN